jgi:dihydroflavonol-4-reductase
MTVLVTGGTGFVGGAVVRALLKRGQRVRVLARRTSRTDHLTALGVEIAYGDILDQASIAAALGGCETFFHVAALYDLWVPDRQAMLRSEVEGTRNALEAARHSGVGKVVYTSSFLTIGPHKGAVGDETTRHRGYFLTFYEQAKYEAEQVAQAYAAEGLSLVIVNPASVYGPGDLKPSGRSLVDVLNGRFPLLFRGAPYGIVYLDDVGEGHALAAERGCIGQRYILCERNVTLAEWYGVACALAGAPLPRFGPQGAVRLFAEFAELAARVTQRPPLVSKDTVAMIAHGEVSSGAKAARDLGLRYTSLEAALPMTLAWYWEQGMLRRQPAFLRSAAA